jgi:hypothetical protein
MIWRQVKPGVDSNYIRILTMFAKLLSQKRAKVTHIGFCLQSYSCMKLDSVRKLLHFGGWLERSFFETGQR